jgi:hypothetical protein
MYLAQLSSFSLSSNVTTSGLDNTSHLVHTDLFEEHLFNYRITNPLYSVPEDTTLRISLAETPDHAYLHLTVAHMPPRQPSK